MSPADEAHMLGSPGDGDARTPTGRDRDRILYSSYLHRLAGVTQVVTPLQDQSNSHSRLIHSFKVANLSREIAEALLVRARDDSDLSSNIEAWGGLDVSACETAGLSHDLGHPPFGHVAEKLLDDWMQAEGAFGPRCPNGFEGNAQSFHIVGLLEPKLSKTQVMDIDLNRGSGLTAVTLSAILKYPWIRQKGTPKFDGKFGAYHMDGELMHAARSWFSASGAPAHTQSLEASIMDLADDVTYAAHDLQDFALARHLPITTICADLDAAAKMVTSLSPEKLREAASPHGPGVFIHQLQQLLRFYPWIASKEKYGEALTYASKKIAALATADEIDDLENIASIRAVIADVIGSAMTGITGVRAPAESDPEHAAAPPVVMETTAWHQIQVLKIITKSYVIETARIGLHQAAQISVMSTLLDRLERWCFAGPGSQERRYLPRRLQALIILNEQAIRRSAKGTGGLDFDESHVHRAIVDYCCSLSDMEAMQLTRVLDGRELPRVIY